MAKLEYKQYKNQEKVVFTLVIPSNWNDESTTAHIRFLPGYSKLFYPGKEFDPEKPCLTVTIAITEPWESIRGITNNFFRREITGKILGKDNKPLDETSEEKYVQDLKNVVPEIFQENVSSSIFNLKENISFSLKIICENSGPGGYPEHLILYHLILSSGKDLVPGTETYCPIIIIIELYCTPLNIRQYEEVFQEAVSSFKFTKEKPK